MSQGTSYYLFGNEGLIGPLSADKVAQLRQSGELNRFAWIINDKLQTWEPVVASPKENPFLKTKESLGNREISGAFLVKEKPFLGMVKGMHSYGLELFVEGQHKRTIGIAPETAVQLNLLDETNELAVNTSMKFQGAEEQNGGVLLRFGWIQPLRESL